MVGRASPTTRSRRGAPVAAGAGTTRLTCVRAAVHDLGCVAILALLLAAVLAAWWSGRV
ncbi:hypothetical protein ACU686_09805 [Yinghuangia aomiensis]